jgi:DNA replication protein DnaC
MKTVEKCCPSPPPSPEEEEDLVEEEDPVEEYKGLRLLLLPEDQPQEEGQERGVRKKKPTPRKMSEPVDIPVGMNNFRTYDFHPKKKERKDQVDEKDQFYYMDFQ